MSRLLLLISTLALISSSTQRDCKSEKCKCCSKSFKSSKVLAGNRGELVTKKTKIAMQCLKFSWRITSSARGRRIRLSIQDLLLARGDFVKIYDGMNKSQPLIAAFTSGHVPHEIVSSGQHMYVDLRTTCEVTERRFKAAFNDTAGKLCSKLEDLPSHLIRERTRKSESGRRIGAEFKFRCVHPYELKGSTKMKCIQRRGKAVWSPRALPSCTRSSYVPRVQPPTSITVGDGCVDIAFAVDCSRSMKGKLFSKSIKLVKTIVNLFAGVETGDARFALLTYDIKAKIHFTFGSLNRSGIIDAIDSPSLTKSCWGATATSEALRKLHQKIFAVDATKERRECTKAAFLITDGYTNSRGSPERFAEQLIRERNVILYAFALRDRETDHHDTGIKYLKDLVPESRVMEVVDIDHVVKKVFSVIVDYSECGLVDSSPCITQSRGRRSVGGCLAKDGDWPWVVALYLSRDGKPSFICGGAIIGEQTVLTSAACIMRNHNVQPEELLVVVGDRRRYVNEKTEETYTVRKISIPENYTFEVAPTYDHDIALLHLNCCIGFQPYARPVCLPKEGDKELYQSDVVGTVVGWGGTKKVAAREKVTFAADLYQVELPITDYEKCTNMDPVEITDNMFCAGDGKGKKDACTGDSGGPFVSRRETGNKLKRPFVVTGIVSWGIGCAQKDTYGAYTKVANYIDWIEDEKRIWSINCVQARCFSPLNLF